MGERRPPPPVHGYLLDPAGPAPGPGHVLFQIPEGGGHGGVVGLLDLAGYLLVAQAPQQGHRLRGAEGQVEPRDLSGRMRGDPLPGRRMVAVQDPARAPAR